MQVHRTTASSCLNHLRKGTDRYDGFIGQMLAEISEGGLTLADIGTSVEEIEELRLKGCKTAAVKWLNSLRELTRSDTARDYESFALAFIYLRSELRKGGLTLADIGTSVEEIEGFKKLK